MRKFLITASVLALAATALPSVSEAETLRWARVGDALTLDPHSQNEGPTHTLNHHIYETLVGRAVDGSLTPRLATDWGILEEDDTVWAVHHPRRRQVPRRPGADRRGRGLLARPRPHAALRHGRAARRGRRGHRRRRLHRACEAVRPGAALCAEPHQHLHHEQGLGRGEQHRGRRRTSPPARRAIRSATPTAPGPYRLVSRDPEVRTVLQAFEDHWDETAGSDRDRLHPRSPRPRPASPRFCRARSTSSRTCRCRTSPASQGTGHPRQCAAREPQHLLLLRHDVGTAGLGQCRRQPLRQARSARGDGAGDRP
jgi:hypothetical protein